MSLFIYPKRLTGKVLWYNIEEKFGFIVPDMPLPIVHVQKHQIKSKNTNDSVQSLKTDQFVEFSLNNQRLGALNVTNIGGSDINFTQNASLLFRNLSSPKIDLTKELFGRVISWNDFEGWGQIKPDGNLGLVLVDDDAIETDETIPGLDIGSRVRFYVGRGPFRNTITAIKVRNQNGGKIVYQPIMESLKNPQLLVEDKIYKGIINKFGFISPIEKCFDFDIFTGDKNDSDNKDVFIPILDKSLEFIKIGSNVDFKLAKDINTNQHAAVDVTGINNQSLEFCDKIPNQELYSKLSLPLTENGKKTPKNRKKRKINKLSNEKTFECSFCDKTVVGEHQWNAHINGKVHKHKYELSQIEKSCSICNIVFTGKAHRDSHIHGKKHTQMVNPTLYHQIYPNEIRKKRFLNKNSLRFSAFEPYSQLFVSCSPPRGIKAEYAPPFVYHK